LIIGPLIAGKSVPVVKYRLFLREAGTLIEGAIGGAPIEYWTAEFIE
jgi:hypothetical protein